MVAKAGGIVRSDWNYSSDGSDRQQDAAVQLLVALEDGGQLLPAIDGLMSMCISCHNMKHAGGIRECDVDGMPLDPSHPWFVR